MKLRLPETYYQPATKAKRARRSFTLLAVIAVALSGWQLFGLPGTLIKRYDPPVDMPWYGFGLAGVFVEADGRWVVHREGYADRMRKYQITPLGELVRFHDSGVYDQKRDTSGSKGRGTILPGGGVLNVKPSRFYYGWLKELRTSASTAKADANLAREEAQAGGAGFIGPLPRYGLSAAEASAATSCVVLRVYRDNIAQEHKVLLGRHMYPVFDSACYSAPWLYVTTDKVRFLHKLYLDDSSGRVVIREEQSLPIDIGAPVEHDTVLGLDQRAGGLFILTSDGARLWFDPQTLAPGKRDRLPGVWQAEYACLGDARSAYNFERGYPVTQAQYELLMRSLVILFLGSLLYLAVQWRHAWKFIAAATTGASSSSNSSSTTSAGSGTPP